LLLSQYYNVIIIFIIIKLCQFENQCSSPKAKSCWSVILSQHWLIFQSMTIQANWIISPPKLCEVMRGNWHVFEIPWNMEGVRTKHYVSKCTARKHDFAPPSRLIIEHNCPVSFSHYRSLCHHATVRIVDHVIVMITFARFADCHRRLATIASRTIGIPSARGYVHVYKQSLIK